MTKAAVLAASLVDVRNIAAHKCVRLEIHVPVEQAAQVMSAFGWPTMADPVPVALARLDPKAAVTAEPTTERRRFNTLPLPQQIALRCGDVNFQRFLEVNSESDAAQIVRTHCRVNSRSEIQPDTKAAAAWQSLDNEFYAYQHGGVR